MAPVVITPAIARSGGKAREGADKDYNYGEVTVKIRTKREGTMTQPGLLQLMMKLNWPPSFTCTCVHKSPKVISLIVSGHKAHLLHPHATMGRLKPSNTFWNSIIILHDMHH